MKEAENKLLMRADEIKVQQDVQIPFDKHQNLFKYKIYECYKPKDLREVRDYIEYHTIPSAPKP